MFISVPADLLKEIPPNAFCVLSALISEADETGKAIVSFDRLADIANMTRSTVVTWLKHLKSKKIIDAKRFDMMKNEFQINPVYWGGVR